MEGHHTRVWPEHWVWTQLVRAIWILWEGRGHEWDVVWLGVRPAFVELGMPEREVLEPEDLPYTILLDVFVFIYATFPPLYQPTWVGVLDAFMGARGHHAPEASFGPRAITIYVDDALYLRVIEEEAVHRAVATSYKGFGKATDIQPLHTLLPIVTTA